jgi:uncharacterized phage-like protein YoqJ
MLIFLIPVIITGYCTYPLYIFDRLNSTFSVLKQQTENHKLQTADSRLRTVD